MDTNTDAIEDIGMQEEPLEDREVSAFRRKSKLNRTPVKSSGSSSGNLGLEEREMSMSAHRNKNSGKECKRKADERLSNLSERGQAVKRMQTAMLSLGRNEDFENIPHKQRRDQEVTLLMEAINRMVSLVGSLEKRLNENINTKKEIKEITSGLTATVNALNKTSIRKWLHEKREEPLKKPQKVSVELCRTLLKPRVAKITEVFMYMLKANR